MSVARIEVGLPAPPLRLPTADGEARSLEDFRGRPIFLSFLGAASCLFCRAHVLKLIQAREAIERAGVQVLLVVYHDPELVMSRMLREIDVPFVILVDRAKHSYVEWGLQPARKFVKLMPGFLMGVAGMMMRGIKYDGPVDDEGQRGGDFVIDASGRFVFVKRMRGYHDRASVQTMLRALR